MRLVMVLICCIISFCAFSRGVDIADINWHSTKEGAKIEHLSIDCDGRILPAIRYTAFPYNPLRMPIHPVQNWSAYTHLEFMIKFDQTVGVAYGYLHSDTEKQSWMRKEFSLNRAIGQEGNLTGGLWYKASVPLDPDAKFSPLQVRMVQFGVTDRRLPQLQDKEAVITISEIRLKNKTEINSAKNDENHLRWQVFMKNFTPDLSPFAPLVFSSEGPAIVLEGKPAAEIVVAPGELAKSSEELRFWIKEITGANLPVVEKPSNTLETKIFLGTAFAQEFANDIKEMCDTDGFCLRFRGKNLYLFGANPKGTMNAVFAFLERNTDIIWPRPDPTMNAVFSKRINLHAVNCDVRENPVMTARGWGTNGGINLNDEIFNTRNRCNSPGGGGGFDPGNASRIPWGNKLSYGGGHNLYHLLTAFKKDGLAKMFEEHPDYFALINGERQFPKGMENNPCFTNPEMLDAFVASVLNLLQQQPLPPNSSLGINVEDNWGLCECPSCLAPIKLPNGEIVTIKAKNFRSTQHYLWLNEVVRRIRVIHPDLLFHGYAYFFTAPAPAIAVHPAFGNRFCPYVRPNDKFPLFSPVNRDWSDRIQAWCKVSPRILLREYYGCGMRFPRPWAEVAAADLRVLSRMGVREVSSEIAPDRAKSQWEKREPLYYLSWDASCHDFWVITRLFWNPDQDVETLRRMFLQRTFRSAAMPMARYYAILRQVWFEDKLPSTLGDSPSNCMKHYVLEKNLEETLRGCLVEAEKLADHPVSKKIIQRHRATFEMNSQEAKELKTPSASVPLLTTPDFTKALTINDFTIMGKRNSHPANKTEAYIFHDAKKLYFRIVCQADADKLHAVNNTTDEEKWPVGDKVELFLSDGKDPNRYYQFAVDCIGSRCDLDNINRMKWSGEWEAKAQKSPTGYSIEITVPFSTINLSLANPQVKALLMRTDDANKENASWGGGAVHQMSEFGDLKLMR